jgi:arylsulfatase A-like enzyme
MDVHSPWRPPAGFDRFGPQPTDRYDGSIHFVDSRLKGLYEELVKKGLDRDTWVVITSDHGEEFGEHGNVKIGHGITLYGEVLRVPLIVHHPEEAVSGRRVGRQVRLVDVAPTILDLLDVPIPAGMEGVSLGRNVTEAEGGSSEDLEAFSQVSVRGRPGRRELVAVTARRFRYILDFETKSQELYDLRADPLETRNVATENRALAEQLRDRVLRFRAVELSKRFDGASPTEIDEKLQEQLRTLGYIE